MCNRCGNPNPAEPRTTKERTRFRIERVSCDRVFFEPLFSYNNDTSRSLSSSATTIATSSPCPLFSYLLQGIREQDLLKRRAFGKRSGHDRLKTVRKRDRAQFSATPKRHGAHRTRALAKRHRLQCRALLKCAKTSIRHDVSARSGYDCRHAIFRRRRRAVWHLTCRFP